MLQIIIWLGCIYLIFKGKELVSIAEASPEDVREAAQKSAINWFRGALAIAAIFFVLSLAHGNSVPTRF